jgi:hypothetical protein
MIDLNRVKIEGLEKLISSHLGIFIKFNVAIRIKDNKSYLVVKSQELKDLAGILTTVFKSLTIENFGGGVSEDKTGYWMPMHFVFTYDSGTNGAKIVDYWYEFETNIWRKL